MRLQFWMVHRRDWRVPYNSPKEFTWLGCITLSTLALMPLSIDGFSPWFHRALGTPYGAVEDYLKWHNHFEVWVDIKGSNLITNESINKRYRVIDALSTETLLIEDETGKAYSVGLSGNVNIHSTRIQAWRGQKISSNTYRLELTGQLISDLLKSLPQNAKRTYLNATLTLNTNPNTPEIIGHYERISHNGNTLNLRSATPNNLKPLANHIIKNGSVIIRTEYPAGSQIPQSPSSTTPSYKSHTLSIPNLPSLTGLTVSIGDEVQEGELIARYINDTELQEIQTTIKEAKNQLNHLEEQLNNELKEHQLKLESLKQDAQKAKQELERSHYLVKKGAEAPNKLSLAQHNLKQSQTAILLEQTRWTSRHNQLQNQHQQAQIAISKAEQNKQTTMQNQWVKAPLTGLISDIKLTNISTKGSTVEIMILELIE